MTCNASRHLDRTYPLEKELNVYNTCFLQW